jgi:hypothetical protein
MASTQLCYVADTMFPTKCLSSVDIAVQPVMYSVALSTNVYSLSLLYADCDS